MRTQLILIFLFSIFVSATTLSATPPVKQLIELGKQVEKQVIKLRGLDSKKPLRWKLTTRPEVRSYLLKTLDEQYKPGELENEANMLKAMKYIPNDMDYKNFVVSLYEEQAGGYYDPKKEIFFLADWISPMLQEAIISHELTHALQDQHFGLDKFMQRIKGNSDAMYARLAVVEGEAMLVMLAYTMNKSGIEVDLNMIDIDNPLSKMLMSASQNQMPEFANAPKAIQELMMFPYLKGLHFISFGRKQGGWNRIDQIYQDLPQSTEQILHPEKYFSHRDPPTPVSLDHFDTAIPKSFKKINEDVIGEFMTLQLLDCLSDEKEKKRAATGWDGDKAAVYKNGKQLAWIQLSIWDTDQDAVEYAGAFAKTVMCRKKGYIQLPLKDQQPRLSWENDLGQTISVERKGKQILIIEDFNQSSANKIRHVFSH